MDSVFFQTAITDSVLYKLSFAVLELELRVSTTWLASVSKAEVYQPTDKNSSDNVITELLLPP